MTEILGQRYKMTRGSDVQRDGMYLEIADDTNVLLAEIFHNDQNNEMTFTAFRSDLPLPVIECLIAQAKVLLTPLA